MIAALLASGAPLEGSALGPAAVEDVVRVVVGSMLHFDRGQVRFVDEAYPTMRHDFCLVSEHYGRLVMTTIQMAKEGLAPAVDSLNVLREGAGWDGVEIYDLPGFRNPIPIPRAIVGLAVRVGDRVRRREVAFGAVNRVRRALLEGAQPARADVDLIKAEVDQ